MKKIIFFIPFLLFAFDIQVVDEIQPHSSIKKDNYKRAKDGKIIYTPMKTDTILASNKIINAMNPRIIKSMNKIVKPINTIVVYPIPNH